MVSFLLGCCVVALIYAIVELLGSIQDSIEPKNHDKEADD